MIVEACNSANNLVNDTVKPRLQPKVSIVIPAYNVEDVIAETLDSLTNQTFDEIEIVCVDDGSSDLTASVIQSFADKDHRIRLIKKSNEGAAIARNAGLEAIKGESVLFLDSDDLFSSSMIEELYSALVDGKADISICEMDYYHCVSKKRTPCFRFPTGMEQRTYNMREIGGDLFRLINLGPCNKLFSRQLLEKETIRFQDLQNANDVFFVASYLFLSNRVAFVKKPLYLYRIGRGTSIQDKKIEHPLCQMQAAQSVYDYAIEIGGSKDLKTSLISQCWELCVRSFELAVASKIDADEAYMQMKKLAEKWSLNALKPSEFKSKGQAYKYWCYMRSDLENLEWAYRANRVARGAQSKGYKAVLAVRLLVASTVLSGRFFRQDEGK